MTLNSAASPFIPDSCLIDLHLHLDGSLSENTARALAAQQDIPVPQDSDALARLLHVPSDCKSLNDYLKCFDFPLTLLQTPPAISESVRRLCGELKEQGLIYAEIRFAPQLHTRAAMTQEDAVQAAVEGAENSDLETGLILCCMRGSDNAQENMTTARLAAKYLGHGVCAADLAGAEGLFPNELFKDIFDYLRGEDIPFTLHAGEADGAQSVRTAVEYGARRIGHGVRSAEDPALLHELAGRGIALEICPTSNINTRVFESVNDLPFKVFEAANVRMCICTDNMSVSNTTLRRELSLAARASGESGFVQRRLLDAAEAAFASPSVKSRLKTQIQKTFAAN